MSLDLATMLIVSVIVCAGCGIFYALDSARTLAGRHMAAWMSGFASTLLSAVCYLAAAYNDDAVWIVAIANASMVAAVAAVWVGCRLFNGRRSRVLIGTLLVGVTGAAAVFDPTDDAEWAGSITKFAVLIVLSLLIVREARRGRLRTAPPAMVLVVVLAVHAVFTAARLAVFLTVGHHSEIFDRAFSSAIVTNMNLVFIVAVAVGLVLLRSWERKQRLASDRDAVRTVGRRRFLPEATRRRGSLGDDERFAIIEVAIDGFADLRRAYGLATAGELEAFLSEAVSGVLPTGSIASRVRNGVVLAAVAVPAGPEGEAGLRALGAPIVAGYREAVAGQVIAFAGSARLGIALDDGAASFDALLSTASAALAQAGTRGEPVRLLVGGSQSLER